MPAHLLDRARAPQRRRTDVAVEASGRWSALRGQVRSAFGRGNGRDRAVSRPEAVRAPQFAWSSADQRAVTPLIDAIASGLPGRDDALTLMRRVCITMYVVGGLTCLSGVWMTQQTPESKLAQGLLAGVFIATGLVIWSFPRASRRVLEANIIWSIVLLGVLLALSEPLGMAPLFFLWPVVYAAYFSTTRFLAVTYGSMVVALATGLLVNATHDLKLDTFTGTTATVGTMAVLVATMNRRETSLRVELAVAAETDPLTGLLNRRSFNPRLEVLAEEAKASDRPLSLVMFDLDHFKRLNDEHGHLAGDRALVEVAAILRDQSRGEDLVSRFGGEEFAVALPGADASDARAYTERVAAALTLLAARGAHPLSTSAGISSLTSAGESVETLLTRADDALYAAKAAGRCRQASWDDGIQVGPAFGTPTTV